MHCDICKRQLAKDEAVYRVPVGGLRWQHEWGGKGIACVCTQCRAAPPEGSEHLFGGGAIRPHWHSPEPCQHCGRPVHVDRYRDHLRYFVCSERCRIAIYNANARQKLHERGQRPVPKQPCVICGEPFTPKRSDAIYCSAACKQRGYRRKQTQRAATSAMTRQRVIRRQRG